MLKKILVAFVLIGSTFSLFGQSKLAFWKKDREYAKNSFSINTSGPIPGGGFSFNHQLNRQTTISAFYGESEGFDIEQSDPISFGEGDNETSYYGTLANNSSWCGLQLNYRPFEKLEGLRVAFGAGVGKLQGALTDSLGAEYRIRASGPFTYMGIGYGLRPVKGLQLGIDIGWLTAPTFEVSSDGSHDQTDRFRHGLESDMNEFTLIPNLQLSIGWGF